MFSPAHVDHVISIQNEGSIKTRKNTGCLTTERSKVEAFYAHLGWNFLVFQTLYSKITLVHLFSNSENGHYVIIGSSADIFS